MASSRAPATQPKRVVIIGMGFVGLRAFRELDGRLDVICIDSKDHFHYLPAAVDAIFDPQTASSFFTEYRANPSLAPCFKQGVVVGITPATPSTPGFVTLDNGDRVEFDFALIGTGAAYGAIKPAVPKSSKLSHVQGLFECYEQIKAAESVIIVGGGAVGVEVACAAAETFPKKKVTLITAGARVLDKFSVNASEYATNKLKGFGVDIIYNERGTNIPNTPSVATISTENTGRSLTGFVIKCTGITPSTEAFAASFTEQGSLIATGGIKVDPTLQVVGLPGLFAAGDVADISEEKSAVAADLSALTAANNIKALALAADNGSEVELQSFPDAVLGKGGLKMPFISGATLGKRDIVAQMGMNDVQTGLVFAKVHGYFATMSTGAASGSWFWSWLLYSMKGMFAGQIKALAKKESS